MTTRVPDDQDMGEVVRSWILDEDQSTADRNRQIGRIMGRVDETRQRRRPWPRNPFEHRAMHRVTGTSDTMGSTSSTVGAIAVLTPVRAMAALAILVLVGSMLLYTAARVPPPLLMPGAAPATLDELVALNLRAWSGEPELLAETYAPDGVHTATFYDRTNEYVGPDQIAALTGYGGGPEMIGPRIDIKLDEGDWRWASFLSLGGGTACLWHAVDGRIVRHDCMVPEKSYESRPAADVTTDPDTLAAIAELEARLDAAWGREGSLEALEAVYAPDAVHMARSLTTTRTYTGPAEIASVALYDTSIEAIGDIVAFEAPPGELAWAGVGTLAGGTVCLYHAVDGMVTRHDCILPIRM